MKAPEDLIKTSEARELLNVSTQTMARLIKEGILRTYPDILDRRTKLISRKDIEALKSNRAEAA